MDDLLTRDRRDHPPAPRGDSVFTGVGFGGISQVNTRHGVRDPGAAQRARHRAARVHPAPAGGARRRSPACSPSPPTPSPIGGMRGEQLQFAIVGPELDSVASLSREARRGGSARSPARPRRPRPAARPAADPPRGGPRCAPPTWGSRAPTSAYAVNMLAGGVDIAKYNDDPGDGDRYDIRVKAAEGEIVSADDLQRIFLRTPKGQMVRLDSVAHAVDIVGPAVINRFGLQYSANFYSNPTMPLGDAVERVRAETAELLPPGYSMELQARAREFAKTSGYVRTRLHAGAGARLHRAGEPVQLVPAAADRHDGAAARGRGRAVRAVDHRHYAQHDLDDRPDPAHGPGREELDPARGPDQPDARSGQRASTTHCARPARSACGRC